MSREYYRIKDKSRETFLNASARRTMSSGELQPLQSLLSDVVKRLAVLEAKSGITPAAGAAPAQASTAAVVAEEESPAVVAYDVHVANAVVPFSAACKEIGLEEIGSLVEEAWAGIRTIVVAASKSQKPKDPNAAILPMLKKTQQAVTQVNQKRLDRRFDHHQKATVEMLIAISWIVVAPPGPTPFSHVKETVGSSDFYNNKVRKEYKGKDAKHILFCDTLKALILDLAAYVKEYHLSGLSWNARGVPFDASAATATTLAPKKPAAPVAAAAAATGGGLFSELVGKRTEAGDSAATGLRKVSKDQQTWRKEFKGDGAAPVAAASKAPKAVPVVVVAPTKARGPPKVEYQTRGFKWVVENQTKDSNPNGLVTLDIQDPKQQVYIYKCDGATIDIKGKVKSIVLDACVKTNVLFDSAISTCEFVNCKRIKAQTRGLCPSFVIDKTDGIVVYLSEESLGTSFVTSKSSEMNVSFPDGEEQKETPIPEQFVHKLVNGSVTSQVSDLYS
jgi:adenylyl cyclase-associated protein